MKCERIALVTIAVLGGCFLSITYVNPYHHTISLAELVLQLSGSRGNIPMDFSMNELLLLTMRMVPDYLMEMYLGTMLYKHFCTASVYVFSRYPKRVKWYFREACFISLRVLLYQVILISAVVLMSSYRVRVIYDMTGIVLLLYHCVLKYIWILCVVVCINLLAIFWGSDRAFLTITGLQIFLISTLGAVGHLEKEVRGRWLWWNPMARMVIGWQDSCLSLLEGALNPPFSGLKMEDSIILLAAQCMIILIIGAISINRYDLLWSNAEEGEI